MPDEDRTSRGGHRGGFAPDRVDRGRHRSLCSVAVDERCRPATGFESLPRRLHLDREGDDAPTLESLMR